MTLALMIFIGAAFSLPGMAGMVLTVGMSVDANVLVFERIREELRNGAAVRMAIRNGFSRATTTIIDSNLTTLITAIVLYAVGNEQLKSFAVTLTLGILMCIYTAVFVSWLLFDLTDRFSKIKRLSMMEIIKELNIDYYRLLIPATSLSLAFILIGLVGVVIRGERIFDIDFTGGISVRMLLKEATPIAEVRKIASRLKTDGLTEDVSVTEMASTEHGAGRIYRIDTSLPTNADMANATSSGIRQTKEALTKYFRDDQGNLRLKTHSVQFTPPTAISGASTASTSAANVAPSEPARGANAGQAEVTTPSEVEDAKPAAESAPPSSPATPQPNQGSSRRDAFRDSLAEALPADNVLAYAGPLEVAQATGTPPAETAAPAPDANSATVNPETPTFGLGSNAVDASRLQSETQLKFDEKINAETIESMVKEIARGMSLSEPDVVLSNPKWDGTGSQGYTDWKLQLSSSVEESSQLLSKLQAQLNSTPIWLSANQIGSSVAGNKTKMAFVAVFASLLALIIYIWVRFERLVYGVAAVIALLHDVLVTLGAIALSYWLKDYLGFLMIEEFKISLPVLAAILTIIGYSLNDTIVIFDRIREVKGKSPYLTPAMINKSINQTMSRTILTALTVFISVIVLYIFGGQGIHAFAFAMLIGVIAGSYSSIYIAAPILLWLRPPAENRVAVRGGSVAV